MRCWICLQSDDVSDMSTYERDLYSVHLPLCSDCLTQLQDACEGTGEWQRAEVALEVAKFYSRQSPKAEELEHFAAQVRDSQMNSLVALRAASRKIMELARAARKTHE